jgi:hypothetical protein
MKALSLVRRIVVMVLASCLVGAVASAEIDAHVGTWKLNPSKSKYSPGPPPQSDTTTIEADGPNLTVFIQGVDGEGKPINLAKNKVTIIFDGKDHATPNPAYDTTVWKRIDTNSYAVIRKKAGKVVATGTNVVSRDGKTRTVTTKGTNAKGEKFSNVAVFDKQ